jgi:hypothetical protein
VVKVSALSSTKTVMVGLTNGTIHSPRMARTKLSTPNGRIVFVPGLTTTTPTFDAGTNSWVTPMPPQFSGNAYLAGFAFTVPSGGLPGGINP